MKDDHYRRMCDYPPQYDQVIDMIVDLNPYCLGEDWACEAVHACIRSVVFGDVGAWCATGNCLAVRLSSNPKLPGYKKVVLAYVPNG